MGLDSEFFPMYCGDMAEERDFERFEFSVPIEYRVPGQEWLKGEATAKNISLGGIQLSVKDRLSLGTRVALRISLPRRNRLTTAAGELVWLKENPVSGRGYHVGVRFTQADPYDIEELLNGLNPTS